MEIASVIWMYDVYHYNSAPSQFNEYCAVCDLWLGPHPPPQVKNMELQSTPNQHQNIRHS